MEIGIGLPATIPGVTGATILDWARKADAGPFSSLGIIDRIVYPNHEPLITLAAAAGATQRIRLTTSVLLAPLRSTVELAKQAASLDSLSGGRLTLGLGIGGREDDFRAIGVPFHTRGKRFEEQLGEMKRIWSGQPVSDDVGPVGPLPVRQNGPELLIGAYSPAALSRVGHWADGYISGGVADPAQLRQAYTVVNDSWSAAHRQGKPRFVAGVYVYVGPDPQDRAGAYIRNYYSSMFGVDGAAGMAKSLPSTVQGIRDLIRTLADLGTDEVILWPTIPDLAQVDRFAEAVAAV